MRKDSSLTIKVSGVALFDKWKKIKVVFVFDANIGDLPPYVRFKNVEVVQHYMVLEQFELIAPLLL